MTVWTDLLGSRVETVGTHFPTRVLQCGSGQPLVLLHGQGGSLENFRHNIAAYAQQYHVIAMDLLWHGLSDVPAVDPALIPVWVAQVKEVLRTLGVGPCHIEGQSLGGWVAATMSLERPDLVRSLVLTTPMGLDAKGSRFDPAALKPVLAAQLAALDDLTPQSVRARVETLFKDTSLVDDEIVEIRRQIYSRPGTNAALRGVAHAYFGGPQVQAHRLGADQLAELRVPTLLYWGDANIGGPRAGTALADALPGARYHCASVGHWAQYERYAEHNEVVLEFLNRPSSVDAEPTQKARHANW